MERPAEGNAAKEDFMKYATKPASNE